MSLGLASEGLMLSEFFCGVRGGCFEADPLVRSAEDLCAREVAQRINQISTGAAF